jgi:hypothetical protein
MRTSSFQLVTSRDDRVFIAAERSSLYPGEPRGGATQVPSERERRSAGMDDDGDGGDAEERLDGAADQEVRHGALPAVAHEEHVVAPPGLAADFDVRSASSDLPELPLPRLDEGREFPFVVGGDRLFQSAGRPFQKVAPLREHRRASIGGGADVEKGDGAIRAPPKAPGRAQRANGLGGEIYRHEEPQTSRRHFRYLSPVSRGVPGNRGSE